MDHLGHSVLVQLLRGDCPPWPVPSEAAAEASAWSARSARAAARSAVSRVTSRWSSSIRSSRWRRSTAAVFGSVSARWARSRASSREGQLCHPLLVGAALFGEPVLQLLADPADVGAGVGLALEGAGPVGLGLADGRGGPLGLAAGGGQRGVPLGVGGAHLGGGGLADLFDLLGGLGAGGGDLRVPVGLGGGDLGGGLLLGGADPRVCVLGDPPGLGDGLLGTLLGLRSEGFGGGQPLVHQQSGLAGLAGVGDGALAALRLLGERCIGLGDLPLRLLLDGLDLRLGRGRVGDPLQSGDQAQLRRRSAPGVGGPGPRARPRAGAVVRVRAVQPDQAKWRQDDRGYCDVPVTAPLTDLQIAEQLPNLGMRPGDPRPHRGPHYWTSSHELDHPILVVTG
jgi:hypothetical protein